MRLRHKHVTGIDSRHRTKGQALTKKWSTDFNMEIDLPVGGADPDPAGMNMTVTGPISVNTNVTLTAWYTDSKGNITNLNPGPVIGGAASPYQWSITFVAPAAGDYTFNIQGQYTPPGTPLSTGIGIMAPFTTA